MSDFIEIEFKNILTKAEYEKIIKYFELAPCQGFEQLNIYYDTKDFTLRKKEIALRTRIKNNIIELTLKQKAPKSILETTDIITHMDLNKLQKDQILKKGEVYQKLQSLNISEPLYEIARLKTIRYEFEYLDNLIAIDKSIYYNNVDYEIELETKNYDFGKKVFFNLLKSFKIKENKPKSKIERAYIYKKISEVSET